MSAPLTDPTIIKILSSGDAANPKNASALEKYALEQQSYNVDANVALLKW